MVGCYGEIDVGVCSIGAEVCGGTGIKECKVGGVEPVGNKASASVSERGAPGVMVSVCIEAYEIWLGECCGKRGQEFREGGMRSVWWEIERANGKDKGREMKACC